MFKLDANEKPDSSESGELIYQKLDELDSTSDNNNIITTLPPEMLYKIFKSCSLKDQLALANVCKLFRKIVLDLFEKKLKFFNSDYLVLKYSMNLRKSEISELCYLCGEAVVHAQFSTNLNMELLEDIECRRMYKTHMENLKYFISDNFKQNVKYFRNLQKLDVRGIYIDDQAVLELAKHCKKLKTLRLTYDDMGEHLQDLEGIENLDLISCRNLDPNHLMAVSQKRNLKSLNIVECQQLHDIPKIIKLCDHWQSLETLRLTAFTGNSEFLRAIINLPALKTLQFYWYNLNTLNFEEHFLVELSLNQIKSLQLKHLKFENNSHYAGDENSNQLSSKAEAIIREKACIRFQSWEWSSVVFHKVSKNFHNFKNLLTLSLHYCRLLDFEQMKYLCLNNEKLALIKIYGCPKTEDEIIKNQWLQEELSSKCKLSFESVLTLKEVMELREQHPVGFNSYYKLLPVLRNIECQFY